MIQYAPVRERLWVKREIRSCGSYEDYGTLKKIIEEIDKELAHGSIRNVSLEITTADTYSDTPYMYFFAERPESDKEMKERIKAEEAQQKAREDYERKQYEALKAKYGP